MTNRKFVQDKQEICTRQIGQLYMTNRTIVQEKQDNCTRQLDKMNKTKVTIVLYIPILLKEELRFKNRIQVD